MKNPLIGPLLLALAVPVTSVSLAQAAPDAGSLLQQLERERKPALPSKALPAAQPPAMQAQAGPGVTVSQFRFAGNTLLSAEQLAPVVANYLNRPLDFAQLQAAPAAVAELYRATGWVVRAYLPQQDIVGGVVTIQIVEAVYGGGHARRPCGSARQPGANPALL